MTELFRREHANDPAPPPGTPAIPPFSVFDARVAEWQNRKRAWIAKGIQGEVGRSAKSYQIHDWADENAGGAKATGDGTSIFDPVLCELAVRWFAPRAGMVVDPFAGGSVRGIVAASLGRRYWGVELRPEQVAANYEQARAINRPWVDGEFPVLKWNEGDAAERMPKAPPADLVFSCPPYGDLERYSDDPADLSTMRWPEFLLAYRSIILQTVRAMKLHRFAVWVVGDFRDRSGHYRNFVGETISAFEFAGAGLFDEAILATPVGSAAMRVSKQFETGRKLAKTHQNVLVFVKGDFTAAVRAINARGGGI